MYICLNVLVVYDSWNWTQKQYWKWRRINHVNIASCWLPSNQLAIDINKDKKLNLRLLHILQLIVYQYTDFSLIYENKS